METLLVGIETMDNGEDVLDYRLISRIAMIGDIQMVEKRVTSEDAVLGIFWIFAVNVV